MAKINIRALVAEMSADFLAEHKLELYNVEFQKEGKDWFLRVYIDKPEGTEGYISTDDCELVSRFLSDKLDEADPIEQNYYLEVSSPGMDRALITEDHYRRYTGQLVDVKLYSGINGKKTYQGILKGLNENILTIEEENGKTVELPFDKVTKTNLAVIF